MCQRGLGMLDQARSVLSKGVAPRPGNQWLDLESNPFATLQAMLEPSCLKKETSLRTTWILFSAQKTFAWIQKSDPQGCAVFVRGAWLPSGLRAPEALYPD